MFVMSIYALGTATLTVTSSSRQHIMAARILNYVYVGMELSVIPVFQSEIGIFDPKRSTCILLESRHLADSFQQYLHLCGVW